MNYEKIVAEAIEATPAWKDAVQAMGPRIVDVFLTGSAVYGSIVKRLYDRSVAIKDVDIVVSHFIEGGMDGWEKGLPKDTDPKYWLDVIRYKKGDLCMDVFSLEVAEKHIVDYCADTPLDVQGIAFNVHTGRLFGTRAIQAIKNRVVAVQSREKAEQYARLRDMTVEQLVKNKAEQLGFRAIL